MNVSAELGDGEEPARVVDQPADTASARVALLDELVDPAAPDGDERDLGRDEERLEDGQEDQEQDLDEREAHRQADPSPPEGDCWRGSRMRAGTPTASLPGGTFFVTTAPAPVRAPSPISTGATSIVSTPRKAFLPIGRAVLGPCRPSWP